MPFTPAYAGNTRTATTTAAPCPVHPRHAGYTAQGARSARNASVHPRACGEHKLSELRLGAAARLPPRMRGTRYPTYDDASRRPFTPTHAGKTHRTGTHCLGCIVHPLPCGEHGSLLEFIDTLDRSLPRTRGTRLRMRFKCISHPFTPAYAGNTMAARCRNTRSAVHPRVCGEHGSPTFLVSARYRSPPRMRGTPPFGIPA